MVDDGDISQDFSIYNHDLGEYTILIFSPYKRIWLHAASTMPAEIRHLERHESTALRKLGILDAEHFLKKQRLV